MTRPDSPLLRDVPARPTPRSALELACRWFMEGRRVDVSPLAAELGVSRVTVHRWIGTRDQLLTEVMWELSDRTLTRLLRDLQAEGVARRVPELLTRFVTATSTNAGVRRMQQHEPDVIVRLCTLSASTYQRRVIDRVAALVTEDRAAGLITLDLDDRELAYVAVRLCEGYAHRPALTGEPADAERARVVLHAVVR